MFNRAEDNLPMRISTIALAGVAGLCLAGAAVAYWRQRGGDTGKARGSRSGDAPLNQVVISATWTTTIITWRSVGRSP